MSIELCCVWDEWNNCFCISNDENNPISDRDVAFNLKIDNEIYFQILKEYNAFMVDDIEYCYGFENKKDVINCIDYLNKGDFSNLLPFLNKNINKKTKMINIRGQEVEIDINCVPLVQLFNEIGLDTKFSCEGHELHEYFNIMFADYIKDDIIVDFISQYSNNYNHSPFHGKFVRWCRKMSGEIKFNWMYIAEHKEHALMDYEIIKSKIM